MAVAALGVASLFAPSGAQAVSNVLGVPCSSQGGVQFCEGSTAHPIKTWDGVPLDANVALPAGADAGSNLPLVVILHGWGGAKQPLGDQGNFDMKPWAQQGYAVVSNTARGFRDSCGTLTSRLANLADCAQGWVRLASTLYEVRDTQYLAGLLADAGLADPQRVASYGVSYAGGQSMALAALKDRTMLSNGTLAPWKSPGGKPMRLAAAAPLIPWSDLVYSLMPNGRTLDYTITGSSDDRAPIGVMKRSFVSGLFATGEISTNTSSDPNDFAIRRVQGYYAPPRADPNADLNTWYGVINAGEPYDRNPEAVTLVNEIAEHHSSYYIDDSEPPAPLFISNGFTDDLFPVDEALRFYNRLRSRYPGSPIKLMEYDWGHQRGQGKTADQTRMRQAIGAWFDYYVKGQGSQPANDVTVLTQTCPKTAPSGGPFAGPNWVSLHPGEVRLAPSGSATILSNGGDSSVSATVDPIAAGVAGTNACATTPSGDLSGVATYRFPMVTGAGYTLLGAPTVIGRFSVTGTRAQDTQVAARLWDVAPNGGAQTLIARGVYRPKGDGALEVFQLHPNAWKFEPGHQAKLELLGNDDPYARASNGGFSITASGVDLRLPVREQPGSGQVGFPAAAFVPAGARLAPNVTVIDLRLRASYRTARRSRSRGRSARRQPSCTWASVREVVTGRGLNQVKRVDFLIKGKRQARDSKVPFETTFTPAKVRRAKSRSLRAAVYFRDGRRLTLSQTIRSCAAPKRKARRR